MYKPGQLAQKMVVRIMITLFRISFVNIFRNTYVGGVAPLLQYPFPRSHTKTKNATRCACAGAWALSHDLTSCLQARFLFLTYYPPWSSLWQQCVKNILNK
jgi:hypothetical protein